MPKVALQLLHVRCSMRVSPCPHQQFGRELKMERWMRLEKDTWRKMTSGRLARRLPATHGSQLFTDRETANRGILAGEAMVDQRNRNVDRNTCINGKTDRWGHG